MNMLQSRKVARRRIKETDEIGRCLYSYILLSEGGHILNFLIVETLVLPIEPHIEENEGAFRNELGY